MKFIPLLNIVKYMLWSGFRYLVILEMLMWGVASKSLGTVVLKVSRIFFTCSPHNFWNLRLMLLTSQTWDIQSAIWLGKSHVSQLNLFVSLLCCVTNLSMHFMVTLFFYGHKACFWDSNATKKGFLKIPNFKWVKWLIKQSLLKVKLICEFV